MESNKNQSLSTLMLGSERRRISAMVAFDPGSPSIARVYDYLLGGKDNFAVDRELAAKLMKIYPPVRQTLRESRAFLRRAINWTAGQGIGQFIDLGAGLPTSPNIHETARQTNPWATVAYVDNDPIVISHLSALVAAGDERVAVVPGDLHDTEAVLSAAKLTGLIDTSRPVCMVLALVLHFCDGPTAAALVHRYATAVAPGSYVIVTFGRADGTLADRFAGTYNRRGFATMYNHSPDDFAEFLDGLEIVPPGIAEACQIMPGHQALLIPPPAKDGQVLAAIARVPE
jgi:hypothetical protein